MSLLMNLRRLARGPVHVTGQLALDELDIETRDELVAVSGAVDYDITIERQGTAILAGGWIRFALNCHCARCLKPFTRDVKIADWLVHLPLEGEDQVPIEDDCVDLTPYVREDIVLALPQHPLCEPSCSGLPSRSPRTVPEPDEVPPKHEDASVWSALDGLKF
jgi:uncharacterized protein